MIANVLVEHSAHNFNTSLYHEDGGHTILRNGIELNLKPDLRLMKQVACITTLDCLCSYIPHLFRTDVKPSTVLGVCRYVQQIRSMYFMLCNWHMSLKSQ